MGIMKISNEGMEHLIKIEGGAQLKMYNDLGTNKGHSNKVIKGSEPFSPLLF
jgi:hypothetical protein